MGMMMVAGVVIVAGVGYEGSSRVVLVVTIASIDCNNSNGSR
jgi:hypothetical protein